MKQCMIYDKENDEVHGGILDDSGNVICGCCGGLIEASEIGNGDDCTHKIIEVYENWINLDDEILGDPFLEPENTIKESEDEKNKIFE